MTTVITGSRLHFGLLRPPPTEGRRGFGGCDRGGVLVDGGKCAADGLAPLVARAEFPAGWRVVLLTPPSPADWHGDRERAAFAALAGVTADDALCRLVLVGLLPALAE